MKALLQLMLADFLRILYMDWAGRHGCPALTIPWVVLWNEAP